MSIIVGDDGDVTVRCPSGTSAASIEKFVCSKQNWIIKHLASVKARNSRFEDVRSYKKILVGGQLLNLEVGKPNIIKDGVVCVTKMSSLKKLLVDRFGEVFLARFYYFSSGLALDSRSVSFRAYRSRWGCCDSANNIVFNYKILMLPSELQDYIIVHELCHTKAHNHSANFKRLLFRAMPDFRLRELELKNYSFICRMY